MKTCSSYKIVVKTIELNFSPCIVKDIAHFGTYRWHTEQNSHERGIKDMSADGLLLIIYVLLALIFSFLCSVAESVLLSITPSFIEGQKESRPKHAALLKRLRQDKVDQSLAAILTLNTIAHTVGAIGAGAKATVVFGSAWFGLFSAVMTLLILFFSEIIPKTLGAVYWTTLVGPISSFLNILIVLLYPIVWLSERQTKPNTPNTGVSPYNKYRKTW